MHGDACAVQPDHDRLRLDASDPDTNEVRQSAGGVRIADEWDTRDRQGSIEQRGDLAASGRLFKMHPLVAVSGQRGRRSSESSNSKDVLEAGTARSLLGSADNEGLDPQTGAEDERSGPWRSAELFGAHRDEVGTDLVNTKIGMATGRRGIDVQ